MPRELRPLVRALGLRPASLGGHPGWVGRQVVAAAIGVGPHAAGRSTRAMLEATDPASVLVIGVAGACASHLRVADVVSPARVVNAADGAVFEPDAFLGDGGASLGAGVLATVDRVGAAVPPGAAAVDMETAAVAAECRSHGVPWGVRRAVSDVPGGLPAVIGTLLRPDGRTDVGAVVRLLVRDPAQIATLIRLGRDTKRAVSAVTAAAMGLLADHR